LKARPTLQRTESLSEAAGTQHGAASVESEGIGALSAFETRAAPMWVAAEDRDSVR
jgi:hypothetical protein